MWVTQTVEPDIGCVNTHHARTPQATSEALISAFLTSPFLIHPVLIIPNTADSDVKTHHSLKPENWFVAQSVNLRCAPCVLHALTFHIAERIDIFTHSISPFKPNERMHHFYSLNIIVEEAGQYNAEVAKAEVVVFVGEGENAEIGSEWNELYARANE